jgi:hypothetical protein
MPSIRPSPPDKEPMVPSHLLSSSPSALRHISISILSRPYVILIIITAFCIYLFLFYRRKIRRKALLPQTSCFCAIRKVSPKISYGYKAAISQPDIPLQSYEPFNQAFPKAEYLLESSPITSYTNSLRSCTESLNSGAIASSSSGSIAASSAGSRDPLPAPTIRRHSLPPDQTTEAETVVAPFPGMFGHDRISGPFFGNIGMKDMAPSNRRMKLPRAWVPGRTDTVVSLNGCRRHVMTIEGDPYRRASAG